MKTQKLRQDTLTFIEQGTVNADAGFVLTTDGSNYNRYETSLSFSQFSGAGQITAGSGLNKSANTLSVNVDDSLEINSDSLSIKSSGITNAMLAGSIDLTSKVSITYC